MYFLFRLLAEIGIDVRKLHRISKLPKYSFDLIKWYKKGGVVDDYKIILKDYNSFNGETDKQYFYQDLIVAQHIFKNNPKKHIDIGSRVDGFVTHVASFRKIQVYDLRKTKVKNKNIEFKKFDFLNDKLKNKTDSLSCLHTVEHVGLGRYGDDISVDGHLTALEKIINLVKKSGFIYLSFPISFEDRVEFNSQRVFSINSILNLDIVKKKLSLVRFDYVDSRGNVNLNKNIKYIKIKNILKNSCGIFTFKKLN